jgi:predicted nuclease of predicted toxin-antitoxin system
MVAEPIRFYFDQHMWASVAKALVGKGIDVLTAQDAARCGLSDPDQLAFAGSDQRVMVTFDTDYLALHQCGVQHAGIAWCPAQKHNIGNLILALLLVHGVLDRASMRNHVEYL